MKNITNGGAAAFNAGLLPPAAFAESGKATLLLRLMPVFLMAPVLGLIPFMGGSIGGSFQPRPGVDGEFDASVGLSATNRSQLQLMKIGNLELIFMYVL